METKSHNDTKALGCGANRGGRKVTEMEIDYYLASVSGDAGKQQASLKLRQKNEQTRQRTSENRLYELHISAYPRSLNEDVCSRHGDLFNDNQTVASSCSSGQGKGPAIPYPTLRSTNQVFNDVVQQAKVLIEPTHLHAVAHDNENAPAHLRYVATYDKAWTAEEKIAVKAARKLPYDSTLNSVLGRPKTVYRVEFCPKASPEKFRDQVLGDSVNDGKPLQATTAIIPLSPRRTGAVVVADEHLPRLALPSPTRTVRVGSSVDGDSSFAPQSWLSSTFGSTFDGASTSGSARSASARSVPTIPRPPPESPRKRLEVVHSSTAANSPRRVQIGGDTFVQLPRSYFSNRGKYTTT